MKEGWDCPFAYILATLANKSSKVDVEQILGRILRQPYVTRHNNSLLNLSYVFTCSDDFRNTLENIVSGLNRAGFSKKDFRIAGEAEEIDISATQLQQPEQIELTTAPVYPVGGSEELPINENEEFLTFNAEKIKSDIDKKQELRIESQQEPTELIIEVAKKEEEAFNQKIEEYKNENPLEAVAEELKGKMNIFRINDVYKQDIKGLKIPQFFIKIPQGLLIDDGWSKLAKENLSDNFTLKDKDTVINFETADADVYKIDLEQQGNDEFVPKYLKMNKTDIKYINEYISRLPQKERINTFKEILAKQLGRIDSIEEKEMKDYIEKVLINLNSEQLSDLENSPYKYASAIKSKILSLQENFYEREFYNLIDKDKIICRDNYAFKSEISPGKSISSIAKSLYEAEENVNDFEYKVITEIASLENIKCWHRNIERKGFCINGFINHYPDFIVMTNNNKILLVETKGDYLSNEENLKKLKMGRKWQELAGRSYRYFMVFQNKRIDLDGAYNFEEFIRTLKGIE